MTLSTSLLSYNDCFEMMDKAVADPRGYRYRINKPTIQAAIDEATFMRMRMHQARKLDREKNKEIYAQPDDPMHGISTYDKLTLRIKNVDEVVYLYMEHVMIDVSEGEALSEVPEIEYTPVPQIAQEPVRQIEDHRLEIDVPKPAIRRL